MKLTIIIFALIVLVISYKIFTREKYIELINDEKEDFKNIMIYRYEDFNI